VKYVEFYAMRWRTRSLGREDKILATHFLLATRRHRPDYEAYLSGHVGAYGHMGITRDGRRDSYLSLFPSEYVTTRPYGR